MKKLLALAALAALTLTGCGGTGKSEAPPALIQPANYEHDTAPPAKKTAPATEVRHHTNVGDDNDVYEITGTNSNGMRFRCYVTDGYSSIGQTCFEYGPAS